MKDIDGIEQVLTVLSPHWGEIHKDFDRHNARFLKLTSTNHDAIGRVLRAHLVIESFLDSFLSQQLGIENIEHIKLSFFQKANLLPTKEASAAFVKPGIIQLNRIRNKFGHTLEPEIENHEIGSIYTVLDVARSGEHFDNPVEAIEAFAPIACAFLAVPPKHLRQLFMEAFAHVKAYEP